MGIIVKELEFRGDRGTARAQAIFDSGASVSVMRADIAHRIATPLQATTPEVLPMADGESALEIGEYVTAEFAVDGDLLHWTFGVAEKLAEEVILGADAFQRWKIKLDFSNDEVIFDPRILRLKRI